MALIFVAAFCSLFLPALSVDQPLHVVVDGKHGNDTRQCLKNSHPIPCQSLSFVAQNLTQNNSVWIEISGELLNLRVPVKFTDYTNLRITGSERETKLHCNESEAGLAFVSVQNLTISSLSIENCGALRNSTSVNPLKPNETEKLNVAVYILNCTNVTIHRVDILSSNGTGLSFYDTNGTVNITESNFKNNSVFNQTLQSGGGGVHIEFTICTPGMVGNCSGDHNGLNTHSQYTIHDCNVSNNTATYPSSTNHQNIVPPTLNGATVPRLGKGGGLYLSVGLDARYNNFTITGCSFLENSASVRGGGMLVDFLGFVRDNIISVRDTVFKDNKCLDQFISSGGGLTVGFIHYITLQTCNRKFADNLFVCDRCTFYHNAAYTGGGTNVVATVEDTNSASNDILFSQCDWINNMSPLGAAVYISPGLWDFTVQGFLLVPLFTNCTFRENTAYQELSVMSTPLDSGVKVFSTGFGAVFISELHVQFKGHSTFSGNNGSAVYLSNGVLEFPEGSMVEFSKNKGHNGGAIAMYGSSVIRIHNSSTIVFESNLAYSRGGAIYTEITAPVQSGLRNCFIESATRTGPLKSDSVLRFNDNKAYISGDSIFATSLRSCKIVCTNSGLNVSYHQPAKVLNCTATFFINSSTISTPPKSFKLNEVLPVHVKPGIERFLNLSVYDEKNAPLKGIIYEALINNSSFSEFSHNAITLRGDINSHQVLELDTYDVTLPINITFDECQPGYTFDTVSKECKCAAERYLGVDGCDPKVYLKRGFWMGYCNSSNTTLCTSYCPFGFCSYHRMPEKVWFILPNNSEDLDSLVCGPHRTGPACGKCVDGCSVLFHSWKYTCGSEELCDWGWLFYLLSEIVPLTFFFIIIIVFNINFTTGYLSSFVLFAQIFDGLVTDLNGLAQFPAPIEYIRDSLAFLYRPFNLDFFCLESLSFCLWKGATAMDVILMRLASVAFALVLVLTTIIIVGCRFTRCNIFSRFRTPTSVLIHGLSAFFVLCYSQSARITFQILNIFCLYSSDYQCERKFVYRMGYMTYLEGEHIQYAVIAIFVLIFIVIIPPLLLLIYPLVFKLLGFCKLSESKLASVLWRVMPIQLLDAFQSSFKDEYRFFAAFYFLYRAIILGTFAYVPEMIAFYTVVQMLLTLVLAVHAVFQPYKLRTDNIIDASLFTNLALINGISLYNFSMSSISGLNVYERSINVLAAVQIVLTFLPLLCLIVLGGWKLVNKYKGLQRCEIEALPPLREDERRQLLGSLNKN